MSLIKPKDVHMVSRFPIYQPHFEEDLLPNMQHRDDECASDEEFLSKFEQLYEGHGGYTPEDQRDLEYKLQKRTL